MNDQSRPLAGATHLECTGTGETVESEALHGLSDAGKPYFARYDLDSVRPSFQPSDLPARRADLWRYEEVLPVRDRAFQISLGEGWTPLLEAPRLASRMGVGRIWVKDEGQNPTGSFKDRGLCLAVSRAKELGARELALPSAGNAGGAASAYGAAAWPSGPCRGAYGHAPPHPGRDEGAWRRSPAFGRIDHGLRKGREEGCRGARLVRSLDTEGAVPCGGEEDHGL